ncbi:leptomycin B resistance protein pmd1 [Tothia fuscella]|uniref:Leptomycin B resistance protein pmd1 n=1 Tax=Tothia fuscella TaxID=1048955 RepID=A0A9P4NYR1_9PEZI|nr:leptomycin B resistance protein pmd1 [Tothia fuscella]
MANKDEWRLSVRPLPNEEHGDEMSDSESKNEKAEEMKQAEKKKNAEEKPIAPPGGMGNFNRVLAFGDGLDKLMMAICFFSAIGAGIAMPLMFLVFGKLVGSFTGFFTPNTNALHPPLTREGFQRQVNKSTMYMVYLGIARFALSYISMFSIRISGLRISARLRLAYLRALFKQPVTVIDETSPGTIAARLTTNSNSIEAGISQQFSLAVQAIAFTLGLYIVAFIKSPILTLVASGTIPIVLITYMFALPFINKNYYTAEAIKDQASSLAFEVFESVRIVVAFGARGRLGKTHEEILKRAMVYDHNNGPLYGLLLAPMFLAVYGTFALAFWFGIRQYTRGHITGVGTIIVVLFSVLWAVMCIGRLYSPILAITKAAASATEIFAVLDAEVPDVSGLKDLEVPVTSDIVFKDVTFAYPSRPETTILNKLCVRFEAGKTTAIVGPSGSGKSTVVGLLERWYYPAGTAAAQATSTTDNIDESQEIWVKGEKASFTHATTTESIDPTSGIFVGDVNLNQIDEKWWRINVGLVQQEPFLFNDTIFNNVANGLAGTHWENETKENKLEMVKAACKEAYADEFISRLPLGYETMAGKSGMKISGGQRQRIAIARAIIKQPALLILDEATSAIDVRTEKIVQKALDRVSHGRTTITIAHRLSTIRKADKIIVVRGGQLVEEGTHEELLQNYEGVYSGFVRAQAVEMGEENFEDISIEGQDAVDIDIATKEGSVASKPDEEFVDRPFLSSFGLLLYEQRARWLLYTLTMIGAIGGGSTYPVQAYLFAKAVEVFTFAKADLIHRGNFWALMFAIQAVAVGIAYLVLGWASSLVSSTVSTYYRQEYFNNTLQKRIAYFDRETNSPGTITSRLSTDSAQLQQLLGTEMGMAIVAILSIIGSIIITFIFGWKLSLVGVLAIMPIVIIAGYYRVHLEQSFEKMNAVVFATSSQFGAEAISGFRTVTSLTMEDTITTRFDDLLTAHVKKAIAHAKYSTVVFAFSDSADFLCQALVFWYGSKLMLNGEYDLVHFFVIYMAVIQSSLGAGMWFSFAPNIVEATAAANRIISIRPTNKEKSQVQTLKSVPHGSEAAGVEFRDVHFSYEEREVSVLSGVNLKILPGQFAAFVGASGSGKSTMISLLERFYDPTSGQIIVGGDNICQVDPESYRKNLSLVAQESSLYEGTIKENVSLSVVQSLATDEAVEAACKSAQIHEFITSLPDGYATMIGSRGVALSGGQRQRLSLARALLRRPQLLLLDEATSNLDSESEKLVQQAIERAAGGEGGPTIISVAHRLATIQNADVIFVMGSGRVLESGSHAQLLGKRGVYYQMCQAQALDR